MTQNRLCEVKLCPCEAERHERTCKPHRAASTAKDLCLRIGVAGDRCVACRRKFRAEDYVLRAMVEITRRRKPARGYKHALCEPPTKTQTKKQVRESAKPTVSQLVLPFMRRRFEIGPSYESWFGGSRYVGAHSQDVDWIFLPWNWSKR